MAVGTKSIWPDRGAFWTDDSMSEKLRKRFRLSRVVLVGDRGLLTNARIREEVRPADLGWITALRAPAIRKLVDGGTLAALAL